LPSIGGGLILATGTLAAATSLDAYRWEIRIHTFLGLHQILLFGFACMLVISAKRFPKASLISAATLTIFVIVSLATIYPHHPNVWVTPRFPYMYSGPADLAFFQATSPLVVAVIATQFTVSVLALRKGVSDSLRLSRGGT